MRWSWLAFTVAVAIAGWFLWNQWRGPATEALASREIAAWGLADSLVEQGIATDKVLVLGNPFTQQSGRDPQIYRFENASLSGLRKGLGADIKVAYPELRPEAKRDPGAVRIPPNTTTPLSFLVAEGAIDELLARHAGTEVVISLIGVPVGLAHSKAWQDPKGPKFAFLFPDWNVFGNPDVVRASVESGKIAAAVLPKPGVPDDLPAGSNHEAEFEKRFILLP